MTTVDELLDIREHGERIVVRVVGDVDMSNADDIGTRIQEVVSNRSRRVEVDLSAVSYLDSAGLRLLSQLAARLRRLQIELQVIAPPGSTARRVIDMSGMTEFVNVQTDGRPSV